MSLLKGKRKVPNVVRGGKAIPFGNPSDNLYYLQGRSHAKGGIDIGANPRTGIEAEGGEVVQIKPNELRVLSAQDFIGGGVSPAKQVLAGANPDKVFNDQERFKDRHRLNDDGTKYQDGGIIRPDPLTPEGKKYYAKISGAANPISPEFDLATSFISVPKLITLGAKGSVLGFRNGKIMDVLENASDKVDAFNNYINNSIIKGIKPIVNYIDKKVPDKYRKQYRNITKKIVETGLSNDYAKPIINGTVSTIKDNINEENNQKQNGGMITAINGNIKNGLIVTPRPKAKGDTNIHIKPSKRETFTAAAKAHGKSVQGFASQILTNKDNYSSAMVKKANFARNASKWNHKACGGRVKAPNGTVTDVNTRGITAPDLWMNTIGQDNAVYDMAANDMISGNRMAMRHANMREDLDYQSGNGRAIRGSGQVRQYQKDFQNRFWDANRLLHNATDPAGVTGDNQSGESNDDIWGEKTNVRTPYGLWSDKNRQMWNDRGFLAANYKGNTVLSGRIADLSKLELPALPKAPTLNAPIGELATIPSSTGDGTKSPSSPTSPTPRRGIIWNDDLTSALANGLGSLGSFGAELWGSNLRSWTPYTESPVKLKTNYNINPQLDRIRESSQEAYRDIDANTASSSTALARKQRVRNQAQYAANKQWGLKENKETELINKDKLNLQGVRNRNTNRLNHWAESDANIANMRRRLRGAAWSNLFDNLNKTVQGYIGRRDQRRRDEATERMFNRAYPHGAAMVRNIQSQESSGDATISSLATNPIAIAGRLATERLNDDIVAQIKKRCGGKTKRR